MSNSEAKRKVMGRVELTPSPRIATTGSSNGVRIGGNVRAKVDMSSFSNPSPHAQPTHLPLDNTQNQQYFNRPLRANSTSLNNSPFLSPGPSSIASTSPNISTTSAFVTSASATPSSPQGGRVFRSPSPIRQLQRNPASLQDVVSTPLAGPAKVSKERNSGAPVSVHARVNSVQIGNESSSRGSFRANSSVSPFINGNASGRSKIDIANSSTHTARSRSPSPSEGRLNRADRRISVSSTASSAISATSRQAATVPIVRAQKTVTITRPPLRTTFSSTSSNYSLNEATSPSLPSPSIAATIAKLPHHRETSNGESSVQSSVQSPSVELAQDAKKNRKILDLEITNKSLLAINSGLEVVKLQQAREIRELKRRLREGRTPDTSASLNNDDDEEDGDEGDDDDSQTLEEEGTMDMELELAHARCKSLVDAMVNQARESILYKYEMDSRQKGTSRVLHPVEIEMMQTQEVLEETRAQSGSVSPLPSSNNLSEEA